MEKQTRITYVLFGLTVLAVILHNAFYGLFKIEESVFFVLVFVFALGFVISVFYNACTYVKKGEPKDLWEIGFLGLVGLWGLIPDWSSGFSVF